MELPKSHQNIKLSLISPPEGLDPIAWNILLKNSEILSLKPKQILFSEGEKVNEMFFCFTGHILLMKQQSILDIAEPLDTIAGALLEEGTLSTYPISAISLQHSEVLKISKKSALNIINNHISFKNYMLSKFRKRMFYAQKMRAIQFLPVQSRICFLLFEKKELLEKIELTKSLIAQATDTTTESVIRILSSLQKDHKIQITDKKIKILDSAYIQQMANPN